MVDLSVTLSGLRLDNPIIPASGSFGFGVEFAEWYDLNILGSISVKGTTREPRFGNPTPRIAECPAGMLNAVGLQNPGVDAAVSRELPRLAKLYRKPVIANVCGFSVDEYVEVAAKMDAVENVGLLEINISCPNVKHGGMALGTDPDAAAEVAREVRAAVRKPVYMKLSPNVTDIVRIAAACADAGADGFSLINTPLGMRLDLRTRRPLLANGTGGMSGPAVLPIALRMVWQLARALPGVPLIGMGGVDSAETALEMMMAGATAVEVGAANLRDPFACPDIIRDLPGVCEKYGIERLADIVGAAAK